MKLPQQPEAVPGEFEGRTAAEAVRLARQALGDDAGVRCWKTRRGGVAGFFAREAFVAGVTPPAGAVKRVKVARSPRPTAESEAGPSAESEAGPSAAVPSPEAPATEAAPPTSPRVRPPEPTLAQLVEWTEDEVVLESEAPSAEAFSEVLAEAQAAVQASRVTVGPREPLTLEPDRSTAARLPGPERLADLRTRLLGLGVPERFVPAAAESTFDGLASHLARLPVRPTPRAGGSVIAVVGAPSEAHQAAEGVRRHLDLGPGDLLVVDPVEGDRQRVTRRRSAKKLTVVLMEAPLRGPAVYAAAWQLGRLKPDYVLGAVSATVKRADVASWRTQLGRVDALALSGLGDTATPCELMGEVPIAFIDGVEASVLHWMLILLSKMDGHRR